MSYQENDFQQWLNSDNVIKVDKNTYIEQSHQWKKAFSLKEMRKLYKREYA